MLLCHPLLPFTWNFSSILEKIEIKRDIYCTKSFLLRTSLINVNKSVVTCRFAHMYKIIPWGKTCSSDWKKKYLISRLLTFQSRQILIMEPLILNISEKVIITSQRLKKFILSCNVNFSWRYSLKKRDAS